MRLSVFWRLAFALFAIIVVMAGVNMYALIQLRQLTTLSTGLVSDHYPAIESAKRLRDNLYSQLGSEKKYRVLKDPLFLRSFEEEAAYFRRDLQDLRTKETSEQELKLLGDAERLHEEYRLLVVSSVDQVGDATTEAAPTTSFAQVRAQRRHHVEDHADAGECLLNQ